MNSCTTFSCERSLSSPSSSPSQVHIRRRVEEQISLEGNVLNEEMLGLLNSLPIEIILRCFSFLKAINLLTISQLNKTFYLLSEDSSLWQNLTLTIAPELVNESVTDWKGRYRQEEQAERNFLLMRKRTFSLIASVIPPIDRYLMRGRTLTMIPGDYYFSFDTAGYLRAIYQSSMTAEVYDVDGKIQKIKNKDWNVKGEVHNQFVQIAILDGRYLFSPTIKLESISSLNQAQTTAVHALNQKIRDWFSKIVKEPNLDEQVSNALTKHYKHIVRIECTHGAAQYLTSEYKAYLIFFRSLVENPPGLQNLMSTTTS
jgi:hypothetical protein